MRFFKHPPISFGDASVALLGAVMALVPRVSGAVKMRFGASIAPCRFGFNRDGIARFSNGPGLA
jgi:hypothetical protein